jgi:hypothetical protein
VRLVIIREEKDGSSSYRTKRSIGSVREELSLQSDVDLQKTEAVCQNDAATVKLPNNEAALFVKITPVLGKEKHGMGEPCFRRIELWNGLNVERN